MCSESSGSRLRAAPRRRLHDRGARADQRLLVGERDRRGPRSIAAKVGARPTAPTIAETTRSAGRRAASDHRLVAGGDFDVVAGDARLQVGVALGIGDRGEFRAERDRHARQRRAVAPARDRLDGKAPRRVRDDLRAGAADRTRRAEQ